MKGFEIVVGGLNIKLSTTNATNVTNVEENVRNKGDWKEDVYNTEKETNADITDIKLENKTYSGVNTQEEVQVFADGTETSIQETFTTKYITDSTKL